MKKGCAVEVACSDNEKLSFNKNQTYKISFPNNLSRLFNLNNYIKIFSQISLLVRKNPRAIFYLHTPLASHLFRIFTFLNKLKIIYFVHGFRFTSKTKPIKAYFFKTIEKILSLKTEIFITINNDDYKYATSNLIKKAYCYKINGIGLDFTKNYFNKKIINKNQLKKILVISAYKKEKGYFEILKVAEILKNKGIRIECYGYGSYTKFNLIKIKKKLKNISFNKFDINLEKKIRNFDILLHLSKREGLPVSVMQCLLAGLPIICYNIRGNNDLVTDKFNGYFVETYKDVPNKIFYLNLEKNFFNNMRLNASRSLSQEFSKKKINLKLYNIIKKHFNYK